MHSLLTTERFVQLVAVLIIAYFGYGLVKQTAYAYHINGSTLERLQERLNKCNVAMKGGK